MQKQREWRSKEVKEQFKKSKLSLKCGNKVGELGRTWLNRLLTNGGLVQSLTIGVNKWSGIEKMVTGDEKAKKLRAQAVR